MKARVGDQEGEKREERSHNLRIDSHLNYTILFHPFKTSKQRSWSRGEMVVCLFTFFQDFLLVYVCESVVYL